VAQKKASYVVIIAITLSTVNFHNFWHTLTVWY